MSKKPPAIELMKLWPTVFLKQELRENDVHNERLVALAREQPTASVLDVSDESVAWLKANIVHAVDLFLRETGLASALQCSASGRFEIQTTEDFLSLCNRPGAYFTGLYVVHSPKPDPDIGRRSDRRPGCITFYDGRTGMNMNAIERDPNSFYHYTMGLVTGLLLMWPAHVTYFIHPNLSREAAIRVAFDIRVDSGRSLT